MNEKITPKNKEHWLELRLQDLTSTDISALFGCSPYSTYYETWIRKRKQMNVVIEDNDRMKWGSRLEPVIAAGIAEDHGFTIAPMKDYIRIPELRLGSSFDFEIKDGDTSGILEIKNVDGFIFKDGWLQDGNNLEAPPHIEFQVQHQLLVSGFKFAKIGALVGGNKVVVIHRERDEAVIDAIKEKAEEFWKSIVIDRAPEPDFKTDAQFIAEMHKYAEPGKIMHVGGNEMAVALAHEYKRYADLEKQAKEGKDSMKAQLLMMIGDAEKVLGDTFTISAGIVGPAEVSYTRDAYRTFKINWKKEKLK